MINELSNPIKIEVLSREADVQRIKDIVMANACCGLEGDGCISVYALDDHITFSPEHAEDLK
jgi:nitrogen regulatory protein PII